MHPQSVDPLVLETVHRVAAAEIGKYQRPEYYNTVPRELFRALCDAGLGGLSIPEEHGGIQASASTTAAVMEALARYDLGPAIFVSVHAMVSGLLSRFGTKEQKDRYLPAMATGDILAAFALTEPNAGSDAAALSTEARLEGDRYILKGNKCYITSAGFAELYLVFARTQNGKDSGISAFLVPENTPGMTIGKPEHKMGCELSPIASLFFDQAEVSKDALLGPVNSGFKVALAGLAGGRVNIAACANGLSRSALDIAMNHIRERKQFGKALAEFQGLQFMVADMYSKLEAARLLTYKASGEIDRDRSGEKADTKLSSSVAKCFATDAAMSITTDAVQLLGGAGYIKEYQVERLMREAKMLQIVEGANQVQRMIIARELLENS
jgi:alkylation response protein AidB-like acyl-CoA dehydrogenase